eukprot:1106435-Prorocentrum_lima.AAC.1
MDKANHMVKVNIMDKANIKAKFKFKIEVMLMDKLFNSNILKQTKELRDVRRLHHRPIVHHSLRCY